MKHKDRLSDCARLKDTKKDIKTKGMNFPGGPAAKTSPSSAAGAGSIPGGGAGIPHGTWPKTQNRKQKQHCNKFNKDFKNGPHQKKQTQKT